MKEKQGTDEVDASEKDPSCKTQQDSGTDIEIERRKNAKRAAEIKTLEADGAAFFMFLQEQAGDEKSADLKEDEDAGLAVEDGVPDQRDVMGDTVALQGVERYDEKDRECAKTIEAWDAGQRGRLWESSRRSGDLGPLNDSQYKAEVRECRRTAT